MIEREAPPYPKESSNTLWGLLRMVQGGERDYQHILEFVQPLFQASGCSLFLKDENGLTFPLVAQTGISSKIPDGTALEPGDGIAGMVLSNHRATIVGDPFAELNVVHKANRTRPEIGSSMVVPLVIPNGHAVGVLNLSRIESLEVFSDHDLELAEAFASQLALIIENAQLMRSLYRSHSTITQIMQSLGIALCVFESNHRLRTQNFPEELAFISQFDSWDTFLQVLPQPLSVVAEKGDLCTEFPGDTYSELAFWDGQNFKTTVVKLAGGGLAWTLQDQTQLTDALASRARLQRLAEIGQMTASVAHEIRNPLTSIAGAAKLLTECPENTNEFAKIIQDEANRLNLLCNEFLDFSKPMSINVSQCDVEELLNSFARLYRQEAKKIPVKILVQSNSKSKGILCDVPRIEQVLHNLIRNALQASHPHGELILVVQPDGFEVLDNGSGISEELLEKLFSPFHSTKAEGTGLGLCMVKKIIDAHQGEIEVSRLQPGTKMKVILPTALI